MPGDIRGIDFAPFCDLSLGFRNDSASVCGIFFFFFFHFILFYFNYLLFFVGVGLVVACCHFALKNLTMSSIRVQTVILWLANTLETELFTLLRVYHIVELSISKNKLITIVMFFLFVFVILWKLDFQTTCAISAYRYYCCEVEHR